jgi:hypothetical protein
MATTKSVQAAPAYELVVVETFGEYEKGQIITEAEKIKELVESEWSAHFVKKPVPQPEDPAAS